MAGQRYEWRPEGGAAVVRRRACSVARSLLCGMAAVFVGGCVGQGASRAARSEVTRLEREIRGLEGLVRDAEQGQLIPRDRLVVSVSEELVQRLASLALPREDEIGRFRIALNRAEVRFQDRLGAVRMEGRASLASQPPDSVFADLALECVTEKVAVDRKSGVLRLGVIPAALDVSRAAVYGESRASRVLVESLAETKLDDLRALVRPIEIPVQLVQDVALDGFAEGPIRIRPARFPLTVGVAGVTAHSGRLWVAVDIQSGATRQAEDAGADGAR
jgi:hypothetical protein